MEAATVEHTLAWDAPGRKASLDEAAAAHLIASELPRRAARLAIVGGGAGRSPAWLGDFSRFEYVSGDANRHVHFSAPTLRGTVPASFLQGDFFRKSIDPDLTAFTLLGESLQDIIAQNPDSERYDSSLLKRFTKLISSAFKSGIERLILEGLQLESSRLSFGKEAAENAKLLLKKTAPPRMVRIAGVLTALDMNGELLQITTDEGPIAKCVLKDSSVLALRERLGHRIVATGTASFRPSGQLLRIDVGDVKDARPADRIFSKLPHGEMVRREKTSKNWVGPLIGSWPGTESEAELLAALKNGPH